MKTIKLLILLLSFAAGLECLTSCGDDGPVKANAPVFAMDENFTITATCANAYKAYVNGIETILPYTISQTYDQQTIVVSGYGYGFYLQNSDTVEQSFVVPALKALEDNHEYVDLGLPSGTLWATCNVGANAPEEYGDYFAWGETAPKDCYDWNTYKWYDNYEAYTKYHHGYYVHDDYGNEYYVEPDGRTELDPADDAATANWGVGARMPSLEQIQELVNSCHWQRTQKNGVNGQLGTGPNGNTIFLPAAGSRWCDELIDAGWYGNYWSRTLRPHSSDHVYALELHSWEVYRSNYNIRYEGYTVRAVRLP